MHCALEEVDCQIDLQDEMGMLVDRSGKQNETELVDIKGRDWNYGLQHEHEVEVSKSAICWLHS